jgi:hypothetical protein
LYEVKGLKDTMKQLLDLLNPPVIEPVKTKEPVKQVEPLNSPKLEILKKQLDNVELKMKEMKEKDRSTREKEKNDLQQKVLPTEISNTKASESSKLIPELKLPKVTLPKMVITPSTMAQEPNFPESRVIKTISNTTTPSPISREIPPSSISPKLNSSQSPLIPPTSPISNPPLPVISTSKKNGVKLSVVHLPVIGSQSKDTETPISAKSQNEPKRPIITAITANISPDNRPKITPITAEMPQIHSLTSDETQVNKLNWVGFPEINENPSVLESSNVSNESVLYLAMSRDQRFKEMSKLEATQVTLNRSLIQIQQNFDQRLIGEAQAREAKERISMELNNLKQKLEVLRKLVKK